ncbi:MAG: protein translocase subunit SecD [Melioribacteraceae bacterium]|nr:protein translocase subunit SecD [Melioribacteraceae bacterium]
MKEFRFRIVLITALFLFSLFLLYPTYQDIQNNSEIEEELAVIKENIKVQSPTISDEDLELLLEVKADSLRLSNETYKDAREKRVKLGLDLQGGMYLVMEVNTAKLLERLANDPDEVYNKLLKEAEIESRDSDENVVTLLANKLQQEGIRLSRYFGSIRESDEDIIENLEEQESDAVTRAIEIIRNRVDQYGVSEPSIQKQGARRIIVELPGIAREEEAKRLIQGRALLEFKLVKEPDFTVPIMNRVDEVLAKALYGEDTTSVETDSLSEADLSEEEFRKKHPFYSIAQVIPQSPVADAYVKADDRDKLYNYLQLEEVQRIIPDNVEFKFSAKPVTTQEAVEFYKLYLVNKQAELTGGVIEDAQANIDPSTTSPIVSMQMNSEGSLEWARITGSNINKRLAIVLDNFVYMAPNINGKIVGGRSQIEGLDNMEEAKLIEIVLKAGALPAPIDIIDERTVGPSLGQDSINQGFNSIFIGFIVVALFMVWYYKKSGMVANLALFFTIVFIMGILAGFQATLTLPGIAGIILTIGMAVDANVLIFERIREELATGKTVRASIEGGYSNSYSAIFDSNITTFFTGIILYQFGSGPVQGFALTLMIGIASSLFAALVVTRLVFDFMASKGAKIDVG